MSITIRKAKKGDGKSFVDFWNESVKSKFFSYTGTSRLMTKRDVKKADERYSGNSHCTHYLLAFDSSTNKLIGFCELKGKESGRARHRAELGWGVHPDYARQGIASRLLKLIIAEAKKRKIRKLEAEVAVENKASLKLAKKCGFSIEGRKKEGMILDNGKYIDTYMVGKVLR